MNNNNNSTVSVGNSKEDFAEKYLISKGYKIIERNYRWKRSEIDIIAKSKNTIVFVEVKFRNNHDYGYPEQFVDQRKVENILRGAEHYVTDCNWAGPIRFDIVALSKGDQVLHFEDAF